MKAVGVTNIKTLRKWALPAGILAVSVVSVIAAGVGTGGSKTAVTKGAPANTETQPTVAPAPDASPEVTINGMQIPAPVSGAKDITIPGGKAHIEVSGGHTHVSAHSSSGGASNTNTNNVEININSNTSNDGPDSSSSVSNSTSIFSTGSSNVNVSR